MLLVRHVMADEPRTIRDDMNAFDAGGVMANHDIGSVPVIDHRGRLVGILTDRDLATRVLGGRLDPMQTLASEIATTKDLVTVSPDTRLSEARSLMAAYRVRRLPVVKGEQLVGVISLGDVAVVDGATRAVGETLAAISDSPATAQVRDEGPTPGTPRRVEVARTREAGSSKAKA
jgi:CBS domain-containing protein